MALVDVLMPKMGESITEGTVIAWYKQAGEEVELDENLLEIGTDKVDTDIPASTAGVLEEILVEEGKTVEVGTLIARIRVGAAEERAVPPSPPAPAADAPLPPPAASAAQPAAEDRSATRIEVVMPKMGESITEGTVIAWYKQVGEEVELDENLLEIGTDKVDTDVPSPAGGTLVEILVPEGATVDTGTPVAIIASGDSAGVAPVPAPPPAQPPVEEAQDTSTDDKHLGDGRFLTPLVRSIASKEGITDSELAKIQGTGARGRINKRDILRYLEERSAAAPTPAEPTAAPIPVVQPAAPKPPPSRPKPPRVAAGPREEVVKMDRLRQLVSLHMTESRKTAAHVTSFTEVDATNLVQIRRRNKAAFQERYGIKLTYTPFLVHASTEALRAHPMLNASVDGTNIILKKDIHIGVAVNVRNTGLVVPVIRHAGRQSVAGLAQASHDLAQRARTNTLRPDDLQAGTFTLTNVGSLGSTMGTPIILLPQVAILATGAIQKRPVVIEDPALGDVIAIRHMMYLSLSYDHRIIDGAMGISFLRTFTEVIEGLDPAMEIA